MRVTISIGGAFPSPYQYAEFLEREGCLEQHHFVYAPMAAQGQV